MKKRLAKILAQAGIASRRKAEKLIFEGQVSVNGKTVLLPQTLVDPEKDKIKVLEKSVSIEDQKYYFLFHKPKNVFCSNVRKKNEVLVVDYFKKIPARLFTAGRLDKDVFGLMIVTNDGSFANRVVHPRYKIEKEYLANVKNKILFKHLEKLQKGTFVENKKVRPVKLVKKDLYSLLITVVDGRKHEVKLLLKKAGLELFSLCRIRIGPCRLGRLPKGVYREMSEKEKQAFLV